MILTDGPRSRVFEVYISVYLVRCEIDIYDKGTREPFSSEKKPFSLTERSRMTKDPT